MEILPKRIYEILKDKGISSIYSANSVITSCSFLRNRCLMSHASLAKAGLFHNSQISGKLGHKYGIWNDIFTESLDIHNHSGSINHLGPVLFELDIEIVKNSYSGKVWVTKSNPCKWETNINHERRWFVSASDLDNYFSEGNTDFMIVFRHCGGKLPIQGHLNKIVIDDPKLETDEYQIDYFSMAYGAIKLAMTEGNIEAPIEKRGCRSDCGCLGDYKSKITDPEKMYSPCL